MNFWKHRHRWHAGLFASLWLGTAAIGYLAGKSVRVSANPIDLMARAEEEAAPSRNSTAIFVPPNRGKPRTSVGGASRTQDTCFAAAENGPQAALVPLADTTDIALTASARPELALYVSEANIEKIVFAVRDETGRHLYQDAVALAGTPGIVRIQLPATAPQLEIGRQYLWSAVAQCSSRLKPDSPRVDVWIERVALEQAIADRADWASPLERAAFLGSRGIWLDMVEVLVDARERPAEGKAWQQVMAFVGLQEIASAPLLTIPAAQEASDVRLGADRKAR